jgi:hypothetical protein
VDSPKSEPQVLLGVATAQETVNTPTGLVKDRAAGDGEVAEVAGRAPSAEEVAGNERVREDSGLAMMLATASLALEANEIERAQTLYEEICELGSQEACVILERLKSAAQVEDGWVIALGAAADEQAAITMAKDLYAKGITDAEVLWMGDYTSLGKKDFWFVYSGPVPRSQDEVARSKLEEVKRIIPVAYGLLLSKTEKRTVLK